MSANAAAEFKEYCYLHSEIGAMYHDAALQAGLPDSVMNILFTVSTFGAECTQSNICRLTGIPKQTVNSAVRKLERSGILYLEEEGRKNKILRLTEAGQALVEEKVMPMMRAEQAIFAAWPEDERQALLRLTRKYLQDFQNNLTKEKTP